jgi:hypothetical protein
MSDNYLRYVPTDPQFKPPSMAADQAVAVLRAFLPNAESVTSRFAEAVEFVDAGSNWEGVSCPSCGADAEPWWGNAMSEAADTQFQSLDVRTACCGGVVSLNELHYRWPVAFASFVLEVTNPNSPGLSPQQLEQLQAVLSCPAREIKAHL